MHDLPTSAQRSLAAHDHGPLTAETLALMRRYFAEKNHRPSSEMWDALADLVATMERMAFALMQANRKKAEPKSRFPAKSNTQTAIPLPVAQGEVDISRTTAEEAVGSVAFFPSAAAIASLGRGLSPREVGSADACARRRRFDHDACPDTIFVRRPALWS